MVLNELVYCSRALELCCVFAYSRFFSAGCIYGRRNDGERFGFFCHASLEFLLQSGFHPDIIHCHDWSSAPVAWLYKEHYRHYGLNKARVVFTIHNLEFGASLIGKAMQYSDKATTVSPTYSQEVSGNPVIASHLYKFHGILNGIDQDIWDPYNDKFIPLSYTSENVVEGKRAAKEALQQRLGLKKADLPLVGIITRLTHQKGIHLIKHSIWHTLERSGQVFFIFSTSLPRVTE
ncbi:soluble starch synthase 3, chloroplastic/amyloplastic-like [Olea europaea var. sylvestris]|uniref:soluble starch synthase 3, chloroplastic/amyloplastic-like n=1 Tax=Olea europaea var. sylvestris TaxID=158386 RepID=UPI000C1D39BF|nr:soluble starch synthase 3, chloroplastic/amyloplastic-like [Olea europaea var. sylvestris]